MHLKFSTAAFALSLLSTTTEAQVSFDCTQIGEGEYRIYQGLGEPKPRTPVGPIKIKKGTVIAYEDRALLTEWYKPQNGAGGVIAYKQTQIVFSHYLINGLTKFCSSQRHADVFGAGETSQHYSLRCLSDKDQDGSYDTFRRYGELVSYNSQTGKMGAATGVLQTDQPLVQPFKLVRMENFVPERFFPELILRSMIEVSSINKSSLTLSFTASATHDCSIMVSQLIF